MPSSSTLLLDDIDDYLGPSQTRFFARGYQRSSYRVDGLEALAGPEERLARGRVDVSYPEDWSRKKDVDLRPHLSTIDAYVLGVQVAEVELAHRTGYDPQEHEAVVRRITIRAGAAPVEELLGIPIQAQHVRTTEAAGPAGSAVPRQVSTYSCEVGGFRVRCELEHPAAPADRTRTGGARFASFDDALGGAAGRFHGEGFTRRRHRIGDVRADLDERTATGLVTFTEESRPGVPSLPGVTPIDGFVVNLQLGQVLMYELDGIRRSESNTLWMMQTVLDQPLDAPPIVGDTQHPVSLALVGARQLTLRDAPWRTVDMRGSLGGVTLRSSFAHQLPQPEPAAAG